MAEESAKPDPAAKLVELWEWLAKQLSENRDRPEAVLKANWLRKSVIEPLSRLSGSAAQDWFNQAIAVLEWRASDSFQLEKPRRSPPAADPAALARQCSLLKQQLAKARMSETGEFISVSVVAEVETLLEECAVALDPSWRVEKTEAESSSADDLASQITKLAESLPSTWPPMRLIHFRQRLLAKDQTRFLQLLERAKDILLRHRGAWQIELQQASAEWTEEAREAVLLVRSLLEEVTESSPGPDAWSEFAIFARSILSPYRLAVELVRDLKQPAEWFDAPLEAEVPEPRLDRTGLAIRPMSAAWILFPKGRAIVPIPGALTAFNSVLNSIKDIAAENLWLKEYVEGLDKLDAADFAKSEHKSDLLLERLALLIKRGKLDSSPQLDVVRQRVLDLTRELARCVGLVITPKARRFDVPVFVEQFDLDECDIHYCWSLDEQPKGLVQLSKFGVRSDHLSRPRNGLARVYVGPCPDGMVELLDAVDILSNDEFAEDLERLIHAWPEAAFKGVLDVVAVQFYVDFWDKTYDRWHERYPEHAASFVNRLFYFLQHGFGLFPFNPVTYQDYPDGWLQRVAGRPMVSGRVRRVIRPGLHDDQNHLRVPALVEVE
jgi:hypothetical protein